MKKNLLLYILLGFLVVVNSFFLFKHFGTSNQDGPQRTAPGNFIANQLEFDAEQLKKFEKIDAAHREKMNAILDDIRASKDALFDNLSEESIDDSELDAITTQIGNKEKAKEEQAFKFFKSVSDICNESQKKRFKRIIKDGLRRQGPPGQNGPPPGGPRGPGGPGEEGRPPPP